MVLKLEQKNKKIQHLKSDIIPTDEKKCNC